MQWLFENEKKRNKNEWKIIMQFYSKIQKRRRKIVKEYIQMKLKI